MVKVVLVTSGSRRMASAPPKSLLLWRIFSALIADERCREDPPVIFR